MREFYLETRSCRLCVCEWGSQGGPAIVCLHGIRDQAAVWQAVAAPLADAGFYVLAPDLRGHGRSSHAPKGTLTNFVDLLADLDLLIAELVGQPVVLVGHSMGSIVAGMYAAIRRQKTRQLILVEPVLPSQGQDDDIVTQLTAQLDYLSVPSSHPPMPDIATAALLLRSSTPALSDKLSVQLAQRGTQLMDGVYRWRWDPLLRSLFGIAFNGTKEQYLSLLRAIHSPVTVVLGDSSSFNNEEDRLKLRAALPAARLLTLPGGHNVHIDAANALHRRIADSVNEEADGSMLARSA